MDRNETMYNRTARCIDPVPTSFVLLSFFKDLRQQLLKNLSCYPYRLTGRHEDTTLIYFNFFQVVHIFIIVEFINFNIHRFWYNNNNTYQLFFAHRSV